MGAIEKKLLNVIKKEEKRRSSKTSVKDLEKSTLEFKKLIDQGFASHRGYNLQTIENDIESHVKFSISF